MERSPHKPASTANFLFSIDLEDVRLQVPNGNLYKERVPENTYTYLNWLSRHNAICTFFVTGSVAKLYPSLIKEIMQEGHEIACHSVYHIPIDRQTPEEFRKDLDLNINLLMKCGARNIEGFRAPVYSITRETSWAYDILGEMGFSYSSSVLPAKNPLHSWKEFGIHPRKVNARIIEIPLTVGRFGHLTVPFAGGIYFRVLPSFIIRRNVRRVQPGLPLVGYFHPYDIDTRQERFMHPEIKNNRLYNFLMYYNRKNVFSRLEELLKGGYKICTYKNFITNEFKQ